MKISTSPSYAIMGAAMLAMATPAFAQQADQDDGGINDIVVTATKMGETRLQATAIAVSAVSGEDLAVRGIRDIQDLKALVPSLQVSDLSGYTQMFVRGIGSNIVFIGSDPSTTLHMDGVYLGRPMSYMNDFLDVERVEVLRGPQGTLYGRNSVGGTVNVISRKPSTTPSMELRTEYGTYDRYALKAYATAPIGNNGAAFSIAGDVSGHDAFRENVSTGSDMESLSSRGVRGQLLLPMGETAQLTLRADYSKQSGTMGAYPKLLALTGNPVDDAILNDPDKVSLDADAYTVMRNYGVAAELEVELGDNIDLRSLTSYRGFRGNILNDSDSSAISFLPITIGPIRQNQFSQELNLIGRSDVVDWVVGAYYFNERNREDLTLAIIPFGAAHIQRPFLRAESVAVFAQTEWHLSEVLSVVAGLRYTKEKKRYELEDYFTASTSIDPETAENAPILSGIPGLSDPFSVNVSRKDNALTPKLGINYKPNSNMLVYASATRGFKSGGYDFGATSEADAAAGFGPEKLWSYEAGIKSDWFDRRLRANLTAFYYDYKDLQVQSYVQNGAAFGARTANAATARVKGVELELMARPISGLTLSSNIAYLDARYREYTAASVTAYGEFDASGQRLNNAPRWSATFGASYRHDMGSAGAIELGADMRLQSTVYFTAANDGVTPNVTNPMVTPGPTSGYLGQQRGYEVYSARIGWTSADERFGLNLFGSNLGDKNYIVGTADYTAAMAGRQGRPREIVGQVTMKF